MTSQHTPLEQPAPTLSSRRVITLGLPSTADTGAKTFMLTPEAVAMLVDRGLEVRVERGAGTSIHYDDNRYAAAGARITEHDTTLGSDIVLHPSPMTPRDASRLHRGAIVLTLSNPYRHATATIETYLKLNIISVALDLVSDRAGHHTFADVISRVDGRAAVTIAASLLADPQGTKGILLGGVPGVIPCEVTILGSGMSAIAAAQAAIGMGAIVHLFDDDTYGLCQAQSILGAGVITSAMHPRVLGSALRTADVIIATPTAVPTLIDSSAIDAMKTGAIILDLSDTRSKVFGHIRYHDLATSPPKQSDSPQQRTCYTNPGSHVRRTMAMAMSNAFVAMTRDILTASDGINNAIHLNPGMQDAVLTMMGRVTNADLARHCGCHAINVRLLIQFS